MACGKPVKGRSDKKFCNEYCRNHFNNQRKARHTLNHYVKSVNSILIRNRTILESLLAEDAASIRTSAQKLQLQNFQFSYYTHQQTLSGGKTCYCCYDYGYLPLNNDRYLVMKLADE